MPIYEYNCPKCGDFEVLRSIKDDAVKRCPDCRRKVTKLISQTSFHLKGGGWYSDAYEGKSNGKKDSSGSESASKSDSDSSSTGSSGDAKPTKPTKTVKPGKKGGAEKSSASVN